MLNAHILDKIHFPKMTDRVLFLNETTDLLFYFLILLKARNFTFSDVVYCLQERHKPET